MRSFSLGLFAFGAVVVSAPMLQAEAPVLSWREGSGFRAAPVKPLGADRAGFTRLAPEITGVRFTNQLSDADLAKNQLLEIGSGVALGDVDGDGLTDVYLCSMSGANRLYRNLGQWRFEDVTQRAGVECVGQFSTGAVLADIEGDGDLDLLVNGIGSGTRLFLNEGDLRFREVTDSGLERGHGSSSLTLADIDGDGDLDLYVANYNTHTIKDSPSIMEVEAGFVGGKFVVKPPGLFLPLFLKSGGVSLFERGEPDVLYRNNGKGGFVPVAWTNGTFLDLTGQRLEEPPKEWGLTAAFRDLDGDGAPDLYVCNDFFHSLDQMWLNDGTGGFRPAPPFALRHTSMSSMAVDFADIDRDGYDDFLVLDMLSRQHELRHRQRGSSVHLLAETKGRLPVYRPEYPRNMLFWNRGDGTYAEIAQYSGVEASEWSWSVAFLDVDLDGYEDALIVNGTLRDANDADLAKTGAGRMDGRGSVRNKNLRFRTSETANLAFRNHGDLTFDECGHAWGFDTVGISHGMALADLDNDGDLDVVVNHMRQGAGLYRNDAAAPRVAVRTLGKAPNVQGIGAKIELLGGAVPRQTQEVMSGGRYLSGDDPVRVFAAGGNQSAMSIRVTWRKGTRSLIEGVAPNHVYEVREPDSTAGAARVTPEKTRPVFEDVSAQLRQPHQEEDFNDFERQPSLHRQLSRLGPGVAWRDLDGDGWEDLIVGGAKNGFGIVYLNDTRGGFRPTRRKEPLRRDQTTVLTLTSPEGALEFLAGLSNYEDDAASGGTVAWYDLQRGTQADVVGPQPWSVGPLAVGFLGQRQALFVGARMRPGRYPEPVPSQLYLREGGAWRLDPTNSAVVSTGGMASGAAWADLDGDGDLELVVACEWGPVRVYQANDSGLREITQTVGLGAHVGWWNGVAAGDFDGDGRLDLVAANWGRNTKYQRHRAKPLRLYYGDWQKLGRVETLESYYDPTQQRYVPMLPLDPLRVFAPGLADKYHSFAAYAAASVEEVTGVEHPTFLEANWLETTLFLNRGDHFEARPLPAEAQLAPAFGVSVGDLDGDGHEDVFLSQNFFDVDAETSRYDAGRGLWLKGDGQGNLTPVLAAASGILVYGEQRGCAIADYDRDGRADLAVGQNSGPTGLFHNLRAKPGWRIRLRGPAWNRDGLGATIRLKFGDRSGPARCVQAGSGYWSQESVIPVLGAEAVPTGVWVRWPDGKVTTRELSANDREVVVAYE